MAAHRSGDSRRLDPLSGRFTDYIVIDTETTGLSVRKGAKLIEIGAVKIRNDELVDHIHQRNAGDGGLAYRRDHDRIRHAHQHAERLFDNQRPKQREQFVIGKKFFPL